MMKVFELLEKLQNELENASSVPFLTSKVMMERDEVLDLIDDIRNSLPDVLKDAKKVLEDEDRIKQSAKRKADGLIEEARAQKQHLIDTNTITKNAYEEADAIVKEAKIEANKIRLRSTEYVMTLLSKTQEDLRGVISTIDENIAEMKDKRKNIGTAKAGQ